MCGICGFLDLQRCSSHGELSAAAVAMADALAHRGPDDSGWWLDEERGIAFGHRRLSVVDLSPEAAQPMHSATGRYVIAYNGEIYNWRTIRRELSDLGLRFRGHSDTEVMLAAISEWGLPAAVERFVGMFAFALWDRQDQTLYLCRDRLGEKPLYYGRVGRFLLFGSELKALRRHPCWAGDIDRVALELLLQHGYIPAPYSIYSNVRKLLPGTIVAISPKAIGDNIPDPVPYWSPSNIVTEGQNQPFTGSDAAAVDELDTLLHAVIRDQMVADVPVGAFLSGGVDSSTVVAIMQAHSSRPVKTFSIGSADARFDEAHHAKAVARHLGTDHTEYEATPADALRVIPELPTIYDEPFADSSQIPTLLVSRVARRAVTVSLSGDGGDELFGGYRHYTLADRVWSRIRWMPQGPRRAVAWQFRSLSGGARSLAGLATGNASARRPNAFRMADAMEKIADVFAVTRPDDIYQRLRSNWWQQPQIVLRSGQPTPVQTALESPELSEFMHRMMFQDAVTYLPDDILVKVDRAAMAASLETRAPFLDHRVFALSWRLPLATKIRRGASKWVLRQVAYRYVPRALIDRPKMGFGIPLGSWLAGPLRDWAETLIGEERLVADGFLRSDLIRERWRQHLAGERDWGLALWAVLMFQAWLEVEGR